MSASSTITREAAREIARSGAHRLAAMVKPDGTFVYRLHNAAVLPGYNLFRHCGAAWAIAEISRQLGDADGDAAAAARAMRYVIEKRLKPKNGGLCISAGRITRLGGTGRAMLALLALDAIDPDRVFRTRAEALGTFILSCRRPDGGFDQKMEVRGKTVIELRADDHAGEALFALARLHEVTGARPPLTGAMDSVARLRQRGFGVEDQNHWMVLALATLHRATGEAELAAQAGEICRAILERPRYRQKGETLPLAGRTQALTAYAGMLIRSPWPGGAPAGAPGASDAMAAAAENLDRLLAHRLDDGSFVGGRNLPEIRIDYIQSAALAFLGFAAALEN
ncbi:MAG: hypothetical protein RLO50_03520 [Azospirillaceae bacterium]